MLGQRSKREYRKQLQQPTISTTPSSTMTKSVPCVGNAPSDGGAFLFWASEPARAMIGTTPQTRPKSMTTPVVVLNQGVLMESPPKAEPLLAAVEA